MFERKKVKTSTIIDNNRIFIMFAIVFILMSIIAPNFLNLFNMVNILKGATLGSLAAVGFTIVMICGFLDLSVGSAINLGAIVVIYVSNAAGLVVGILAAIAAGLLMGFLNGIFVTKGKIHPFIVTLGMLTTVKGLLYILTRSISININDFEIVNVMEGKMLWVFTPKILITIILIVIAQIILMKTKHGRAIYLMGGNKDTAWFAGYNTDKYILVSFMISAAMAAIAGALFALSSGTAVPNMGEKGVNPQLLIIASTIIGGTSMNGGKGSVVKSAFAVLTLTTLFNGFSCLGSGYEVQIASCGLILAAIVSYEAYSNYKKDMRRGQRSKLLSEIVE